MDDDRMIFSDADDDEGVSDPYVYKGDMSPEDFREIQHQSEENKVSHINLGSCKYCGQMNYVEGCETIEEAEAAATLKCGCARANAERRIIKRVDDGNQLIYKIFGEEAEDMGFEPVKDPEVFAFLTSIVEMTARGFISSSTINIRGMCRAKINLTSKEKIKVERTEQKSYQLEE